MASLMSAAFFFCGVSAGQSTISNPAATKERRNGANGTRGWSGSGCRADPAEFM